VWAILGCCVKTLAASVGQDSSVRAQGILVCLGTHQTYHAIKQQTSMHQFCGLLHSHFLLDIHQGRYQAIYQETEEGLPQNLHQHSASYSRFSLDNLLVYADDASVVHRSIEYAARQAWADLQHRPLNKYDALQIS
jgi:hypothetical protein